MAFDLWIQIMDKQSSIVKNLAMLSFIWLLASCRRDPMPAIIAEFQQIKESCEVVTGSDLYQKYKLNKEDEVIVKYMFFLDDYKNHHLSGCGLGLESPEQGILFLERHEIDSNPVWQIFYYRLLKQMHVDSVYQIKCIVDGISNAGNFMEWGPKHLVIEQQNDGLYTCTTYTEPGALPKLSEKQSGE